MNVSPDAAAKPLPVTEKSMASSAPADARPTVESLIAQLDPGLAADMSDAANGLIGSASAPVLESEDFMELDSVTQSAVADLVEDGQLRQGTISL
jgi:hypothetical protein